MQKITALEEGAHYDERVARRESPESVDIDARYHSRIARGNYRWFLNERLYGALQSAPSGRVLDVACGTGFYSVLLAKFGHQVVSIDISRQSIEYAKRLAALNGCAEKIEHHVMDISKLDLDADSFDYVTGEDSIHHLIKYPNAIENMYRVLKPGGKAWFWEPFAFNPLINAMRAVNVRIRKHEGEQFLGREELNKLRSVFDEVEIDDKAVLYTLARFFRKPGKISNKVNVGLKRTDDALQRMLPILSRFYSLGFVEMAKR